MKAKVVSIKKNKPVLPTGCTVEKVSFKECKKLLNADDIRYTDEEVHLIRDYVHLLAEINYLYYLENQKEKNEINKIDEEEQETKIININNSHNIKTNTEYETQSHTLRTSEYRRTS